MERTFDVIVSAVGLVLLAPVLAVIGVLIKRDSDGPAVFRQVRVGRGGQPFVLFKFRSMRLCGADSGPGVTAGGDARITQLGKRLRSTKLDEIPQLANVIRGDMALVGPRPELPKFVSAWSQAQRETILSVRPGITDPVTLALRREEELLASAADPERYYRDVLLPAKARGYVDYVNSKSFSGDLTVLWSTLLSVLRD